VTVKNRYPLPNIQDVLDTLEGATVSVHLSGLGGWLPPDCPVGI
jgi:hypothetical protein